MTIAEKPIRHLLATLRCNRAATAIEFAIVAPVLFLLLIGIVELGLIFFAWSVLEGATDIAARVGKTGSTADDLSREAYITQYIDGMSYQVLDISKLNITITSYSTFSQIGQPGDGVNNAGGGGNVVVYKVTYPWSIFTPLMSQLLSSSTDANGNPSGILNITAVATVRNEPF